MAKRAMVGLAGAVWCGIVVACGGSSASTTPNPVPTPTATPVPPTPASPSPTPDPMCTIGLCEPPTTNTAPPDRVLLKLYQLFNENGQWVLPTPDPYKQNVREPIPVGYTIRFDVTGKDADGNPTNGKEDVTWLYSDPSMISDSIQSNFQRKVKVLRPGKWELYVLFDGVPSNSLGFTFCDPAADSSCKYP